MRSRYILIFLTLVLLVVPFLSVLTSAYPLPQDIQKGDIVLIEWKNKPAGIHTFLTWNHAMIYIGKFNGVPRIIHAWNGIENLSWNTAISYNDVHGVFSNQDSKT